MDYNRKKKERKKKVSQWEREPNVSATTVWKRYMRSNVIEKKIKRKEDREVGQNWGLIVIID